jgi:hypothetical protein
LLARRDRVFGLTILAWIAQVEDPAIGRCRQVVADAGSDLEAAKCLGNSPEERIRAAQAHYRAVTPERIGEGSQARRRRRDGEAIQRTSVVPAADD